MQVITRTKTDLTITSSEEFLGYVNTVMVGTKKKTYYNLGEESQDNLIQNIDKMINTCRPFAVLFPLADFSTDDARIVSGMRLFNNSKNLSEQHKKWEAYVLGDMLSKMQPNRVFDLFAYIIGYRRVKIETSSIRGKSKESRYVWKKVERAIGGRYAKGIMKDFLQRNRRMFDFWSVKYRKDMRRIALHLRLSPRLFPEVEWLFGGIAKGKVQKAVEKCRKSDILPTEVWSLPKEVARGFALNKYKLTSEEFEKKFSEVGMATKKEVRIADKRVKKAGGVSKFDPAKQNIFDLFVYFGGQDELPSDAEKWVLVAAKKEAKNIGFTFKDTAIVVDTSQSMYGSKETSNHPLYRALSLAFTIQEATEGYSKIYFTSAKSNKLIPRANGASKYAPSILRALKEGGNNLKQIVIIGDGYENSPEGMTHRLLFAFKKKIDTEDRINFMHLNPVQAGESVESVREITPLIPSVAIRDTKSIGFSVFMALAKKDPERAIQTYLKILIGFQREYVRGLMPTEVNRLIG